MPNFVVSEVTHPTGALAEGIARLIPQMTSNRVTPLTIQRLQEIIASGTRVYVAQEDGHIIGVGVLGKVEQLVGTKYWLEDIVVDENHRGRGVASALMDQLLGIIPSEVYSVNLTSKSARPEAQAWYQRLGFEHKSNVYRLKRD